MKISNLEKFVFMLEKWLKVLIGMMFVIYVIDDNLLVRIGQN